MPMHVLAMDNWSNLTVHETASVRTTLRDVIEGEMRALNASLSLGGVRLEHADGRVIVRIVDPALRAASLRSCGVDQAWIDQERALIGDELVVPVDGQRDAWRARLLQLGTIAQRVFGGVGREHASSNAKVRAAPRERWRTDDVRLEISPVPKLNAWAVLSTSSSELVRGIILDFNMIVLAEWFRMCTKHVRWTPQGVHILPDAIDHAPVLAQSISGQFDFNLTPHFGGITSQERVILTEEEEEHAWALFECIVDFILLHELSHLVHEDSIRLRALRADADSEEGRMEASAATCVCEVRSDLDAARVVSVERGSTMTAKACSQFFWLIHLIEAFSMVRMRPALLRDHPPAPQRFQHVAKALYATGDVTKEVLFAGAGLIEALVPRRVDLA